MIFLALMTVVSIVGRALFGFAIEGDYEMVEMGLAIAIFSFLPECQQKRGHVVVDFFTLNASKKTLNTLDTLGDVLFSIFSGILVWRLYMGGLDAFEYQEQTMILELPLWCAYVVGVVSMSLLFLCCVYSSIKNALEYKEL